MKTTVTRASFTPITITLTFESRAEMEALAVVGNLSFYDGTAEAVSKAMSKESGLTTAECSELRYDLRAALTDGLRLVK